MDWTIAGLILALFAFLGTMWWQVNSRMDAVNNRMDALNKLLTDNLIVLNRDIGELRGQAHTHAE